MTSCERHSEGLSLKGQQKRVNGPTIFWDVEGMEPESIGKLIDLVFRFHSRGVDIRDRGLDGDKA